MKKFLTSFCLFVSVFCLCFGLTACGKKNSDTFKVTANNLTTEYYTTDTVSFENLTLTLTYASLVTETLTVFDIDPEIDDDENWTASSDDTEFAIFTNGLYSQTSGELVAGTYKITARIIGYSGEYTLGTVTVKTETEADTYNLLYFEYSDEINQYKTSLANISDDEEDESYFSTSLTVDNVQVYEVGDDNEFIFKPVSRLIAIGDEITNMVTLNIAVTVSVTDLYGIAQDDSIYTFNSETYGFQFSEDAVGNVYIIYMTPTNFSKNYYGQNITPLELTIYVEDGWNAYTAEDLGRISLLADDDIAARKEANKNSSGTINKYSTFYSHTYFYDADTEEFTSVYFHEIWSDYFIEKGVFSDTSEITTKNGLFIHSNITITEDDIPSEFIISSSENSDAAGTIRDWSFLYTRFLLEDETFTLGGNYFTIDASELKPAKSNATYDGFYYSTLEDELGHSQLFAFGTGPDVTYDATVYVRNIASIGNSGTDYDTEDGETLSNQATENTGSIMFMKSIYAATVNIDNCIVNQYLIAFYAQMRESTTNLSSNTDTGNLVISNTKVFDCFSSGVYSYCSAGNSITNSVFKRFGGPVILSVSNSSKSDGYFGYSNTTTTDYSECSTWEVDDASVLESYVDCTEAWFVLNKATSFVTYFSTLNSTLSNYGKTIYNSDSKFNFIMVALDVDYLSASYPYLHSYLTSSGESTTYNFNTDYLGYLSSNASSAVILATNVESNIIYTDFNKIFYSYGTTSTPTSISGTKMYLYLPTSKTAIGAVIDLYSSSVSG